MRVLVTGGAGYIGSHTCKLLAREGHEVTVYDNLSRGHRDFVKWGALVEGDVRDQALLGDTLRTIRPDAVIHFAAFAYVGESVSDPGLYFRNNAGGTLSLLEAMRESNTRNLIVSSTCATYGQPDAVPIAEDTPRRPLNAYGMSKLHMEQMCESFGAAHGIRTVALRYFNACGADPEGDIGERHDPEPHLIPRMFMAATGEIAAVQIFGDDYPTPDGTCVRDYIHVCDLASAHAKAARYLLEGGAPGAFNLGTGRGLSVRQVLDAASRAAGRPIAVVMAPRRAGDPAELVADPARALGRLGWRATRSDPDSIMRSAWSWHCRDRR